MQLVSIKAVTSFCHSQDPQPKRLNVKMPRRFADKFYKNDNAETLKVQQSKTIPFPLYFAIALCCYNFLVIYVSEACAFHRCYLPNNTPNTLLAMH